MSEPTKPVALSQEGLQNAVADIAALLLQLGQGQQGAGDVQQVLDTFWTQHGDALSASAATLGEQVRQQLLAQLYGWRGQLESQLGPRPPTDRP
jgi:hypothetical protein